MSLMLMDERWELAVRSRIREGDSFEVDEEEASGRTGGPGKFMLGNPGRRWFGSMIWENVDLLISCADVVE